MMTATRAETAFSSLCIRFLRTLLRFRINASSSFVIDYPLLIPRTVNEGSRHDSMRARDDSRRDTNTHELTYYYTTTWVCGLGNMGTCTGRRRSDGSARREATVCAAWGKERRRCSSGGRVLVLEVGQCALGRRGLARCA
ncbi:hypothetical protein GUJ93_ZPchr0006g43266 [Zizania palustris]|uniref:Uncharacterized protein n=1 Tax=Zizania palustris TaxID=103762 RepID=A0A8J5SZ73_ZIZPA|nr:hypothetical protein GUJ93_ZPchr0006g43266 [Zizania palustris]